MKENFYSHILLVDKPKAVSSFDVIRVLRKKLCPEKVGHAPKLKLGHAGTLDPLATGLLIIGIGEGTKQLSGFLKLPKTYEVEILLGIQTDTGDLEGRVVKKLSYSNVLKNIRIGNNEHRASVTFIADILEKMRGEINLPVPAYSAVKQRGVPLYKRARRGERVKPPIKKMEIRDIGLLDIFKENKYIILKIRIDVGSGTYVRSVAEEMGRRLGVPAVVKELRRTKIGEFDITQAKKLEDI